jgi:multiple inositol-polyphosphate phosphatase/2,3-bisphosphoglycerate 3-phosphatase
MLKMCQYEYLIDKTDSVWCKFFDDNDLRLIEYREDIKYHCKYGYKYPLVTAMTCDLLDNLLDNLKNFTTITNTKKRVQLLFGHSSTMLPFYTLLGIARSKSDFNFADIAQENKSRLYRMSQLDPMNTNIAFVVYDCGGGGGVGGDKTKLRVRAFQNERLIKVDGCQSGESCGLDEFLKFYQKIKANCGSTRSVCQV